MSTLNIISSSYLNGRPLLQQALYTNADYDNKLKQLESEIAAEGKDTDSNAKQDYDILNVLYAPQSENSSDKCNVIDTSFFNFTNLMDGLSDEEKAALKEPLEKALFIPDTRGTTQVWGKDESAVKTGLTKVKLDFITDNLVPDRYKDIMREATDEYISMLTQSTNDTFERDSQIVYDIDQSEGLEKEAQNSLYELQDIKAGNLQKEQNYYVQSFSTLAHKNGTEFKQTFAQLMNSVKSKILECNNSAYRLELRNYITGYANQVVENCYNNWNEFILSLPSKYQTYYVSASSQISTLA